ncbi:MAG TPA: glycosyltransferase, partial [Actinomycetota bacterium]|nr:glycosyltransferase [Actinomycetota bacterium]
ADVEAARRWLGVSPEAKVVLYFGRLVERKGVHNAIRAMPAIRDRVPDARLVVAGTGPQLGRLRRLAEGLHVPAVFTGRVPQELAAGVYAAADAFTLPVTDRWFGYEIEGLGVVLLEAAAAGTACVTGRSGGTPEAVVDGVTGFVVDAAAPSHLVRPITDLLTDEELASRMGEAGRRHVESVFTAPGALRPLLEWLG